MAIKQCTELNKFKESLDNGHPDRNRLHVWLYPSVRGRFKWKNISPLNLLNYVFLSMKSRYATMTACAMMTSLYDDPMPHARAGTFLQGWHAYVDKCGTITWQQFMNLVHQPLPDGRLAIDTAVDWIRDHRDIGCPQTIIFWHANVDVEAPPREAPYAVR